jgi:hypothetical protein
VGDEQYFSRKISFVHLYLSNKFVFQTDEVVHLCKKEHSGKERTVTIS